MLFFGPGDFSQGIGAPGEWNHPKLVEARKRVVATARKHGKFAGTVGNPGNMNELIGMGYQFISVGADVIGVKEYFEKLVTAFGKSTGTVSGKSYLEG
jgi:4-hydroxy-2-oxoheptanedioate aldolase